MQEKEQDIKPKFQESDKHRIEQDPEKEQSSRIFAVYWTHDMYTGQPKLKAQCENRFSSQTLAIEDFYEHHTCCDSQRT